jgi:catechol 2,3-dioxygenase-like lactoylglutathione lyase family enzyme
MRRLRFNQLWMLLLFVFWCVSSSLAAVLEVGPIGLTVDNLDRAVGFYTEVLSFQKVHERHSPMGEADALLGLKGTELRSARMRLGDEEIVLTEHRANKGRPFPPDSRSHDHWFQHIAIVVRDIDRAYARLRQHKIKHVSTAPQTLPAWNKDAGGIKAFYFRDPDEHVLEIIWFPPDKGDAKWQRATDRLFLGIDHTAIVVSDTDRSLAFYRDRLGLRVAGGAENYGSEQEHLNQVFGARLRITALRASRGPGIEFLEYIAPPGGRPLPADAKANDLVFWETHLHTEKIDALVTNLRDNHSTFLSTDVVHASDPADKPARSVIVRDPDGHALRISQPLERLR